MGSFNPWDEQARRLLATRVLPHFAPDPSELQVHRRLLGAHRAGLPRREVAPRLLVLGATPELSDLGLELGYGVVRVDSSPAMFEAARWRETTEDRREETCLVADWRDLGPFDTGSVDAVVGDAALNNVAHADMAQVLRELRRVVRPGGVLSLKQIVLPDEEDAAPEFAAVLEARRRGALDWTAFRMLVRFWCFRAAAYDEATLVLDAARVYDAVDAEQAKGTWDESEVAHLAKSRSSLRHTVYPAGVQASLLRTGLGPCRRHTASDALHHRLFFPIYEIHRA